MEKKNKSPFLHSEQSSSDNKLKSSPPSQTNPNEGCAERKGAQDLAPNTASQTCSLGKGSQDLAGNVISQTSSSGEGKGNNDLAQSAIPLFPNDLLQTDTIKNFNDLRDNSGIDLLKNAKARLEKEGSHILSKKALLEVKDLSVSFETYSGKVQAVSHLSFSIYPGETVAIVGESGSGKSVTALSILRLLMTPAKFDSGSILFEGKDLLKLTEKEMQGVRGKKIGIVFQDPMTSLNPTLTIGKQIMEGLKKQKNLSSKEAREKGLEILQLVGISEAKKRFDQYPHQFSGGMRQRVMIAIALISSPKLLIADEPTTALDVTIQAQILELMKSIQAKRETSIILITHDLGIVAGIADRVIVMYGGKIVEMGKVEDIYQSPFHPYTKALLRSLPRLDMDKNKELIPIHGSPPNLQRPSGGCLFAPRCQNTMHICQLRAPPLVPVNKDQQAACWLQKKKENDKTS